MLAKTWIILAVTLTSSSAGFFEDHARGWHWYEEKPIIKPLKKKKKIASRPLPMGPTEVMKAYRKELDRLKNQAILVPTVQNVRIYQEFQRQMMDRAEKFSEVWQHVVMTTPHLDETIKNPVTQIGRHIHFEQEKEAQDKAIKALAQTHGLFFFFRANCPYCHTFAPIVKNFAEAYGWKVVAVSMDGSSLPEFPNARRDNGISDTLNIKIVPSLIAANPSENEVIPLSNGLVSEEEIKERLIFLVKQKSMKGKR